MGDEDKDKQQPPANSGGGHGGGNASDDDDIKSLPPWAQREIKDLRKENADRRGDLRKREEAEQQAEQKRLAEQGKFQQLAEQQAKELDAWKAKGMTLEQLEKAFKATLDARLKLIPDTHKSLVPEGLGMAELSGWLDKNESLLRKPAAPNLNAGAGNQAGGQGGTMLTPAQVEYAEKMGVSLEDYAKNIGAGSRMEEK